MIKLFSMIRDSIIFKHLHNHFYWRKSVYKTAIKIKINTWDKDLDQCGWLGEWLFELPEEELFKELMEHIDDFLEPRLDGEDGGVWKDQLLSELFRSAMTCSEAGGRIWGSEVCFSSCWTASWRWDISVSMATSSSYR